MSLPQLIVETVFTSPFECQGCLEASHPRDENIFARHFESHLGMLHVV